MQTTDHCVGVLGASSFVGTHLLMQLGHHGLHAVAFTRRLAAEAAKHNTSGSAGSDVEWRLLPAATDCVAQANVRINRWISLLPIRALPDYLPMLEVYGARRIIALSTTSLHTKQDTPDPTEQALVGGIRDAEMQLQVWAEARAIEWVVLRPTLIYDFGRDANLTEIARFIRRFGFFPVFGKARGLRQPVHAEDVAAACIAALLQENTANRAYNISGAETLPYREMVARIFAAMGRPARLLPVPLWAFRLAMAGLRTLPRYRAWNSAMAERMNRDMAFDHADATRDFGYAPRPFHPSAEDVESC